MAEAKLCPLRAGAVQAQFKYLMTIEDGLYDYDEARAEAQEEFGMYDHEKCAMWVSEWERCPENPAADKLRGKCGLIAAKPYVVANQHYHP